MELPGIVLDPVRGAVTIEAALNRVSTKDKEFITINRHFLATWSLIVEDSFNFWIILLNKVSNFQIQTNTYPTQSHTQIRSFFYRETHPNQLPTKHKRTSNLAQPYPPQTRRKQTTTIPLPRPSAKRIPSKHPSPGTDKPTCPTQKQDKTSQPSTSSSPRSVTLDISNNSIRPSLLSTSPRFGRSRI